MSAYIPTREHICFCQQVGGKTGRRIKCQDGGAHVLKTIGMILLATIKIERKWHSLVGGHPAKKNSYGVAKVWRQTPQSFSGHEYSYLNECVDNACHRVLLLFLLRRQAK